MIQYTWFVFKSVIFITRDRFCQCCGDTKNEGHILCFINLVNILVQFVGKIRISFAVDTLVTNISLKNPFFKEEWETFLYELLPR